MQASDCPSLCIVERIGLGIVLPVLASWLIRICFLWRMVGMALWRIVITRVSTVFHCVSVCSRGKMRASWSSPSAYSLGRAWIMARGKSGGRKNTE